MEGGFFVGFALFLFVVGLADEVVAGDVEGGVGGVEGGFEGGAYFCCYGCRTTTTPRMPTF